MRNLLSSTLPLWAALLLIAAIAVPGLFAKARTFRPPDGGNSGLSNSLQMLVVTTGSWDGVQGTAQRYERFSLKGKWHAVGPGFPVVVGKTGLGWGRGIQPENAGPADGPVKHEGDGKAPAGIFVLPTSFGYSPDPLPGARMPYTALSPGVECVDDSASSHYNQLLNAEGMTKDWSSSEQMRRSDELYRWGVFVAHNSNPPQSGAGSCIFLHIWRGPDQGTVGCTAMQQANIESLLLWLDPGKHPVLVQLPDPEYARYRKAWSLPRHP